MALWQRANPIIQQVSFIIIRATGDFILFDADVVWCCLFSADV